MRKRIITSLLAALMLTGSAFALSACGEGESSASSKASDSSDGNGSSQTSGSSDKKSDPEALARVANGSVLQVFSWDFNTIKESMPDIAAAGFTAVQTSPVNECLVGEGGGMELYGDGKWYYHYQPTDFKIGNYQLGTRDEFKEMCDEAHKYDVKVIVDKVTVKNVRAVVNTGVFELESLVIADFGKDTPAKIEVAGAKLVNPKGFPEPNAFTLKALNIGLETADLKKTPMVFHDIIVDSTYAGMVYNDDGVSNIDAMFKPFMGDDKGKDEKKDKKDVAKDEKKDEKKDDSPHVVIDKLDISGTKVQYRMVSLPIPLPTFTDIGKKSESGATLKEVGEQVWDKAKDAFTGVGGLVGMLGSDATNVLGNAVGFVGAGATNLLGNAAGLVTGGVSNVVSGASNVLSGAAGAINSATGGVIGGGVSNVMKGASSVIGGAAEGAKGLSEKAAEGAKDALKKLGTGGGLFGN